MFSHLRYWTSSNPGTEFSPFAITLTLFDFGLVRVYYLIQYCSSVSHFVYIWEILWNSVLFTETISILYRIFLQVLNFHLILFLMDTPFFLFLVTEKSSFYISIMDKKNLVTDYSCVSSSSLWIGSNGSTPWPRSGSGIQNILLLLISIPNLLSTQRCTFQYIQRPGQWKNIYTSLQVSVNTENRYIYIDTYNFSTE